MNLYEQFYKKQLPEPLQTRTEQFASQGKSTGEVLFRVGYYIGKNWEQYKDELIGGEE